MIATGLAMMFIGMGTVLIFLSLMILCMNLMSKVIAKINEIYPEPVVVPAASKKVIKSQDDDAEIALAIAAAMFSKK